MQSLALGLKIKNIFFVILIPVKSPCYNHTGWLGIKRQLTSLLISVSQSRANTGILNTSLFSFWLSFSRNMRWPCSMLRRKRQSNEMQRKMFKSSRLPAMKYATPWEIFRAWKNGKQSVVYYLCCIIYFILFFTDGILVLHKAGNCSSIHGSHYPVIPSILPVKMSVYNNTLLILKKEIQLSAFDK